MSFGILESYPRTLLAIAVSIATELALGKLLLGKWPHPASAYITRNQRRHPGALACLLALRALRLISITSKYVLRVKDRHIWNPSNFGISALLFLAAGSRRDPQHPVGQHMSGRCCDLGTRLGDRLAGSAFHITRNLRYFVLRVRVSAQWDYRHQPWQSEVAPITGPMYQLFIFFMITDPKTTVRSQRGQCVVAFLIALVEMVLRLDQIVYAPFYALFLVGPAAYLHRDLARFVVVEARTSAPAS